MGEVVEISIIDIYSLKVNQKRYTHGVGSTEAHSLGSASVTFIWLLLLFLSEPLCTQSVTLSNSAPWLAALSWDKVSFTSFSSKLSGISSVYCILAILASAILRLASSSSSRTSNRCYFWRRCSWNWSCCSCSWSLWSSSWWRRSLSKWNCCCSCWNFWRSISCFSLAGRNALSCWRSSSSLRCFALGNSYCLWLDVFDVTDLPDLTDTVFFVVLDGFCDVLVSCK